MSAPAGDPGKGDASEAREELTRRAGSFFGRRKGHKLRARQAELIGQLLPRLALDISGPPPANLAAMFGPAASAVRLEIGFGGGEHLAAEARERPGCGFIGCEPYVNGMAKILNEIDRHRIGNIRLFAGDAAELLAWLPTASLARVELIHPDPWPKRRHWKRRFVQHATVAALARVLAPRGEFRFVSDIDDYSFWTLSHVLRSPDFTFAAERAEDWRRPWDGYTMTRYGRKAEREGRRATYLRFRRGG